MTVQSKWLEWEPETPGLRTDTTDTVAENHHFRETPLDAASPECRIASVQSVSSVSSLTARFEQRTADPDPDVEAIRERWNERAAIAEYDGGLSRTEAELLAWDELRTCVRCHRDTQGEADAVRVSGGGWLHLDKCYDGYFGFRQE